MESIEEMGNKISDSDHLMSGDNCDEGCPVSYAAEILDGKWTTQIVRELLGGTKRFSELQRGLSGVSPKVLTTRLKLLEAKGLVNKTIYPCVPPKTEYTLTALGVQMKGVILSMAQFGELLAQHQERQNSDR